MRRFVRTEEEPATATSTIGSTVDLAVLVVFPVSWAFQPVVVVRMVVEVETLRNHLLLTGYRTPLNREVAGLSFVSAGNCSSSSYEDEALQVFDIMLQRGVPSVSHLRKSLAFFFSKMERTEEAEMLSTEMESHVCTLVLLTVTVKTRKNGDEIVLQNVQKQVVCN
ncbi:hypothetical protein LXL04_029414 [Taraxacum kok-saghyz]